MELDPALEVKKQKPTDPEGALQLPTDYTKVNVKVTFVQGVFLKNSMGANGSRLIVPPPQVNVFTYNCRFEIDADNYITFDYNVMTMVMTNVNVNLTDWALVTNPPEFECTKAKYELIFVLKYIKDVNIELWRTFIYDLTSLFTGCEIVSQNNDIITFSTNFGTYSIKNKLYESKAVKLNGYEFGDYNVKILASLVNGALVVYLP